MNACRRGLMIRSRSRRISANSTLPDSVVRYLLKKPELPKGGARLEERVVARSLITTGHIDLQSH